MSNFLKDKENKKELTDIERVNHVAIMCYLACCVIISIFGWVSYRSVNLSHNMLEPVLYYVLLWLPLFVSMILYKDTANSQTMKYVLFIMFGFFYAYVMFVGREHMFFLFAIPMMLLSIIYFNLKFSMCVGLYVVAVNLCVAIGWFWENRIRSIKEEKFLVVIIVLISTIIINVCAYVMVGLQKQKLTEMEKSEERFKALVSVGIKRIFEYDIVNNSFMTNRSSGGLYGPDRYIHNFCEIAKQYRYIIFEDWPLFDEFIDMCKNGTKVIDMQMRLRNLEGDYKWFQIRGKTIFNDALEPIKVIGTLENIDEIKRMEIRQADETMRDSLTKLYKRPYVKQLIEEFFSKQDNADYAGFLVLDIDNFSILNEKMGVAFGDEILKNIAADIENIFYPTDVIGRLGGDEFVVLMKNISSIDDIDKKIKEIQKVINRTYVGETMNYGSTVGIGASIFPIDGTSFDVLYEKAEKALFHAKEAGKNCYGFYDIRKEDIYEKYQLKEKQEKILEAERTHEEIRENASDSLIELAFKLIEDSKDTDSAINLLIRQVSRQLNLGGICIRERVGREYKVIYPYQCYQGVDFEREESGCMEYTPDSWDRMIAEFYMGNGLICTSDTSKEKDDTRRKLMLANGIRSCARCAFYDKGEFVGNIDFLDYTKEREWTKEDISTIRAVTNVVSSYLLKMKAYEDASDTVERLTGYDPVTGLFKYEKFLTMTSEYIENAPHGNYAIVYLDFTNFKFINDTYGYEIGDRVLKEFADDVRKYDNYFIYGCRIFSDNIIVLIHLPYVDHNEIVEKMHAASTNFTNKIKSEYVDSNLIVDIGICMFTISGKPVFIKNIISNANMARKEAKLPDNPRCVIYNENMGDKLKQEITYANDMENAFKNKEFVVYMQPKINLINNEIDGAEALVRWKKADGTIIYPNDFIPVFEKNKTITLLDYYVYDEVCKYIAKAIREKSKLIRISVNVSRVHLFTIRELVDYVDSLLKKYQIPAHLLEFELTETVFTEKLDDTVILMNELRKLGVKVSMDDFGSGYSSLNVLTRLPIDVLKLDKDFLKNFEADSDEKIIIPSIIDMAKKLKLSVVCEGVETSEQVDFLKDVGCDYAQGYYYSKPVSIAKFDSLLASES